MGDDKRRLDTLTVLFHGLLDAVGKVIEQWNPGELETEIAYRNSLENFLRKCGPKAVVERERRDADTTTDLYVAWTEIVMTQEVFIELKRNLVEKGTFDRLIGQIEQLNPSKRNIVVVLCGESDPQYVGRLRERYRGSTDDLFFSRMRIVEVAT